MKVLICKDIYFQISQRWKNRPENTHFHNVINLLCTFVHTERNFPDKHQVN